MRNSSLVEQWCAENVTGLSGIPKLRILCIKHRMVGEHSMDRRRYTERCAGGDGRENAGISTRKDG